MSRFLRSRINCLNCPKVQTEAEETFDDLKKSFESFQSKIRAVSLKDKRKKLQNLRQMTIHNMFNY
jgi:MFS superfamily sulfate permease-like transporter